MLGHNHIIESDNSRAAFFNLENGTVEHAETDAGISEAGDGWYRIWMTTEDHTYSTYVKGEGCVGLQENGLEVHRDTNLELKLDHGDEAWVWGVQQELKSHHPSPEGIG